MIEEQKPRIKYSFFGHESFTCKHFWLKKGFDYLRNNKFSDENAVIELGVGKNMVTSIRYWLKAFALIDNNDRFQEYTNIIFSDNGLDPYVEDLGTVWFLHYLLVKTGRASIYNLVFNEFRRERQNFTKAQLHQFLKRKCEETDTTFNENTIAKDISVFIRSYTLATEGKIDIEDDYAGVMPELSLLNHSKIREDHGTLVDYYWIDSSERDDLPWQLVLLAILDNPSYSNTISFKELEVGYNSPGLIFALNEKGLYQKIQGMVENYPEQINYSTTAGNRVLTVKKEQLNKYDLLTNYYGQ